MRGSRVQFFEHNLSILQYEMAYRALNLVKDEMCKEKGFMRHNGTHYFFHLVDVAQKLLNAGIRDEDIITAALLHDLVEDVLKLDGTPKYSIKDLSSLFNDNVAHMVDLLTKKQGVDYKTNKEELQLYLTRISENLGASLIKVSDRLHNITTILDATHEKRLRQAIETEIYFLPFFKTCRKLYPWHAAFFFEAKTIVEPQIQMIKEHHEEKMKLIQELQLATSQNK